MPFLPVDFWKCESVLAKTIHKGECALFLQTASWDCLSGIAGCGQSCTGTEQPASMSALGRSADTSHKAGHLLKVPAAHSSSMKDHRALVWISTVGVRSSSPALGPASLLQPGRSQQALLEDFKYSDWIAHRMTRKALMRCS